MNVLVLGATGMLGHRLLLSLADGFNVKGAVRGDADAWSRHPLLGKRRLVGGLDAMDPDSVSSIIDTVRPDIVLNCVGVIKQVKEATSPIPSIAINALFPHVLEEIAVNAGARVIHFSTDCVFSGRQGPYKESDFPDADDLYGRTKLLGELTGESSLTLRTSVIGHELRGGHGLLEWFLSMRGTSVPGYARALYSGVTTNQMADIIRHILRHHPQLSGVWQVASTPIDKFTLLSEINSIYSLGIEIQRDESFICDRRLNGERFWAATGVAIPCWREMIEAMHEDYRKTIPNSETIRHAIFER